MDPIVLFAVIGALGIGSQWIAWRLQMPAIVLMLAAGLLAGPGFQIMDPDASFGELFKPIVAVAVAVILFEGGLTLNYREIRETAPAVRRLVLIGAPLGWLLATLAIRYGAGLSWESSTVFGGILIVTGPTVIIPLLRQARLRSRPASILRWEAIVNDPVGALCAVLAYEVITAIYGATTLAEAAMHLFVGIAMATVVGFAAGWFLAWAFKRGHVPEFMKVPVLFGMVLAVYASTDTVLHESGLLAVTIMGVYLANAHLPSFDELRRFKEHVTIILVSGVFILLAASLEREMIFALDWRILAFIALIVFVARPITVALALAGTGLSWQEKFIVGWIAPRGIVAVAVAGLFGTRLADLGIEDGALLAPMAFALVAATVVISGFSIIPVSRLLNLTSTGPAGVLIVGGSRWAVSLAETLKKAELPVLIADRNWFRLRAAREAGIPVYHGEILSEAAEHTLDLNRFGTVIAATDNDAYNALVCTDLAPEFGRGNVLQIGRAAEGEDDRDLPVTLGGRKVGAGLSFGELARRMGEDKGFSLTRLGEEYGIDAYRRDRPDADIWAILRQGTKLEFVQDDGAQRAAQAGDAILGLGTRPDRSGPEPESEPEPVPEPGAA